MSLSYGREAYLSSNKALFDQKDVWKALTEGEQKRIEETLSMLPSDVITILNVGCGDGRVTNALPQRFTVVGVDINITPLRQTAGLSAVASVESLPFRDRSFDLVLVTEMLEHLPAFLMDKALEELQRAARKYVLLTVPNREVLEVNMTWCSGCRRSYHLWNHLQSFDRKRLQGLLTDFVPRRFREFGFMVPRGFRTLHLLAQKLGHVWSYSDTSVCPSCGSKNQRNRMENALGYLLQRLLWRLEGVNALHRHAFVGTLYERKRNGE